MTALFVSADAAADTAAILQYLADEAGIRIAIKFRLLFSELYRRLETFPQSGMLQSALGENIRISAVFPYTVIYRYLAYNDTVAVLRVLHNRRHITRRVVAGSSAKSG